MCGLAETRHSQINGYLLKSQKLQFSGLGSGLQYQHQEPPQTLKSSRTLSLGMWETEGKLTDSPVRSGLELFQRQEPGKPAGLPWVTEI